MSEEHPSPELLRQLLRYEPETGKLFWRGRDESLFSPSPSRTAQHIAGYWNSRYAGKEAFTFVDEKGYLAGSVLGFGMRAHRVIWAIETGAHAKSTIDHISGDRSDNRLGNLREATNSENLMNRGPNANNTSGFKGVRFDSRRGKWSASIKKNYKGKFLGYHDSPEKAHAAYCAAAEKLHGEFARVA